MKMRRAFLAILFGVLCFSIGCEDAMRTGVTFQNNSTTRTVYPVWDGVRMPTLAPGQKYEISDVNPGTHTIQWKDASNNRSLTSIGWPNLVEGRSYTFSYD